jgi:hypothetical protein
LPEINDCPNLLMLQLAGRSGKASGRKGSCAGCL